MPFHRARHTRKLLGSQLGQKRDVVERRQYRHRHGLRFLPPLLVSEAFDRDLGDIGERVLEAGIELDDFQTRSDSTEDIASRGEPLLNLYELGNSAVTIP